MMQHIRFGEYLVKHSKQITPEQIRDALLHQKESGDSSKKLGEILVEMKLITEDDLREYLIDFNINRFVQFLIEEQGMDLNIVEKYADELRSFKSMEPDYHNLAEILEGNDIITEEEKERFIRQYIDELQKS